MNRLVIVVGIVIGCMAGIYFMGVFFWFSQESMLIDANRLQPSMSVDQLNVMTKDIIIKETLSCYKIRDSVASIYESAFVSQRLHALISAVLFFSLSAMISILGINKKNTE